MALFNSFLSTLGTGLKTITGGGDYLSEEERKKQEALNSTIKNAIADAKLGNNQALIVLTVGLSLIGINRNAPKVGVNFETYLNLIIY